MPSNSLRVLIADDEADLRHAIRSQMAARNFQIDEAGDGETAFKMIETNSYDLVLLDVKMPKMDGLTVLKQLRALQLATTVAVVTAHANLKDAVQAIHDGAFDYIEKPLQAGKLDELINKALDARALVAAATLSSPIQGGDAANDMVGTSDPMRRVFQLVDKLGNVSTSVLVRGENGTGKELIARAIHANSPRKDRPFVAVNCGAIPEGLIESELFGHEKGAFTGANQRKIGKFQFASGGTLFLDEVGDLPLAMQVKLLRVLQEQKITPVGSNREVKIDARIIAATNRNLEDMMEKGTFRQDLFYRLNVMPIVLPPLRKRAEDIPNLIQHFVSKFNRKLGKNFTALSIEALAKLKSYDWPGNIRELENAVEHAFVIESSDQLTVESFPEHVRESILDKEEGWKLVGEAVDTNQGAFSFSGDYQKDYDRFEKEFIIQALKANHGRINQTCDKANIPKNTLLRKIRKYGIVPKDYE